MNQKKIVFTKSIFRKTAVKASVLVQLKTCRLTAFPKGTPSQMLFLTVKFNRRSFLQNTAVRLLLISWNIFNVSLALSAINQFSHTGCLGLWEKRSKCLLWKYLKQNEKTKVNGNILWLRLSPLQKQSPGRDLQKRCFRIFGKTYRKTPLTEPFPNKVLGRWPATLFNSSELLFYSTSANCCLWSWNCNTFVS